MIKTPSSLIISSSLLVLFAACQTRSFELTMEGTIDGSEGGEGGNGGSGGVQDAARPDTNNVPQDALPRIDRAPTLDACVSTGIEICNGIDDDCNGKVDDVDVAKLQDDPFACGSCDVVCGTPTNATATCVAGKCGYTCQMGAVDVDNGATNGCECLVTGATDVCDGRDNDCNGKIDEAFNLDTDINNCGVCNKRCAFPFAKASCVKAVCVKGDCLSGYYDRDGNAANGCESACQKTNNGVEACDGVDNDCNGMVDENPVNPNVTCKAMGVCAGATPQCKDLGGGVKGWACTYSADHEEAESTAKNCDGKDNDCDGRTDEGFGVGGACTVGIGACKNTGALECDPDKTKTRCNVGPKPGITETCNGQDDDCDGKVDELSAADRTSDDKLVYLSGPDVTMFAYEAARADATAASSGMDSGHRPCAVSGRLPWASISKEEASDACKAIGTGWRLCTRDEWFTACKGSGGTTYPYAAAYDGTKCNGYDYVDRVAQPNVTTVASGAASLCKSDHGSGDVLLDMSGNVREWVFSTSAQTTYELRGGAYNTASFNGDAPGLKCDAYIPAPTPVVRLPSVGFRCCLPGRLQ